MLNLLPKDYKNKIRNEYVRRFFIILFLGLSIMDIFIAVSIFPSYTFVTSKKEIAEGVNLSIKNSVKVKNQEKILQDFKDLETRLTAVEIVPGSRPTGYIDNALKLKEKVISIQNISYTKKDGLNKEVTLEGTASSRASLIDFSKRVKASSWVSASEIPLANLAGDRNIKFFITLTATSTKNEL